MEEFVLQTHDLGISFGGLKAVQGLNLNIKQGVKYITVINAVSSVVALAVLILIAMTGII